MPHPDPAPDGSTGLDPQHWDALRALAHRMLDDSLDHLAGRRDEPVWRRCPTTSAPFDSRSPTPPRCRQAYEHFLATSSPTRWATTTPGSGAGTWAPGNPVGDLADLLASVLNPNLGGADHSPVLVEQQVVRWCAEAAGYPTDASGLLVTGASEANLVGLAVARAARIGPTLRTDGMPDGRRFTVYASTGVHSCHRKSCELLGLELRRPAADPGHDDHTIDPAPSRPPSRRTEPTARAARDDRHCRHHQHRRLDDLDALADLAEREGLWFHVDGAIGGFLALTSRRMP